MSQLLAVRVPDELSERLTVLSRATRRPKAVYIREALEAQLDRIEWEQGILQELEDIRAGRVRTYSDAEVRQILGLDD